AAVPQLQRVNVLMSKANPAGSFFFDAMASRAKALRLKLDRTDVSAEEELEGAVAASRGAGLAVVSDALFYVHRERVPAVAIRSGVPSIYSGRDYVEAGGLMSYVSSNRWHWRTAADFVSKILKGAKPAEIPVQQPTKFELVVNLNTAKALR